MKTCPDCGWPFPCNCEPDLLHYVNCNQCGSKVDVRTEIGLAFNMGHGPVYVCVTCAPPASAKELTELFERFIKGVEKGQQ